jgi:hypothetical protein
MGERTTGLWTAGRDSNQIEIHERRVEGDGEMTAEREKLDAANDDVALSLLIAA